MSGESAIAVVGLGGWGIEHLRAWQSTPGARVTAVCDRDGERARDVAAQYGVGEFYTSVEEMLSTSSIEAASVVNDERERLSATALLARAGVHVLIEKPIAVDAASAAELVEVVRRSAVIAMPGHVLRFDIRFAMLRERIERGDLGSVRSVYARRLIPVSRYWHYQRTPPALMASLHDFDLARWLIGREPTEVTAYPAAPDPASPDVLFYVLRFDGNAIAVIETAFALPDAAGTWLESETEVIGSEGVARVRLPSDSVSLWLPDGQQSPEFALTATALDQSFGALRDEISYFLGCVRERTQPRRATMSDGMRALDIALAAIESERAACPVAITVPTI